MTTRSTFTRVTQGLPLTTERLRIREVRPEDTEIVFQALLASQGNLMYWLPWAKEKPTLESTRSILQKFYTDSLTNTSLVMALFHEKTFVGLCSFTVINWQIPSASIGYWCHIDHANKGYTSEAVEAICRYGFEVLGLKRISITCHENNDASRRVAEKCGFSLELHARGIIPNHLAEDLCWAYRFVRFYDS